LTYPSLALDNAEVELQKAPGSPKHVTAVDENNSTLGVFFNKLRGIGRSASSKMLRRSSSVPGVSSHSRISKMVSRKSSMPNRSADSDADISSLAGSNMSSVELSELAVEEHVPDMDMITQA